MNERDDKGDLKRIEKWNEKKGDEQAAADGADAFEGIDFSDGGDLFPGVMGIELTSDREKDTLRERHGKKDQER